MIDAQTELSRNRTRQLVVAVGFVLVLPLIVVAIATFLRRSGGGGNVGSTKDDDVTM